MLVFSQSNQQQKQRHRICTDYSLMRICVEQYLPDSFKQVCRFLLVTPFFARSLQLNTFFFDRFFFYSPRVLFIFKYGQSTSFMSGQRDDLKIILTTVLAVFLLIGLEPSSPLRCHMFYFLKFKFNVQQFKSYEMFSYRIYG